MEIVVSGVPRLTPKTRYPANNNFAEYHSTLDVRSSRYPSRALLASIDRFSLIPTGPPGFPVIRDYLYRIRDYIRYTLYSTL